MPPIPIAINHSYNLTPNTNPPILRLGNASRPTRHIPTVEEDPEAPAWVFSEIAHPQWKEDLEAPEG